MRAALVVLEGDSVLGLVHRLCEIEVMNQGTLAALLSSEEVDCHIKFTPSLILAAEWRFVES